MYWCETLADVTTFFSRQCKICKLLSLFPNYLWSLVDLFHHTEFQCLKNWRYLRGKYVNQRKDIAVEKKGGQKDKWWSTQYSTVNSELSNISPISNRGKLRFSGRLNSSCSTSGTVSIVVRIVLQGNLWIYISRLYMVVCFPGWVPLIKKRHTSPLWLLSSIMI